MSSLLAKLVENLKCLKSSRL